MVPIGIRRLFAVIVVASLAGCDGSRTTPAGPTGGPTITPAPTTVSVRLEGKIIGERDEPVPGAVVTTTGFCGPGLCASMAPVVSQAADGQGNFVLLANLHPQWDQLNVEVTRDGFERTRYFIMPNEAKTTVLRLLPKLTIRPGQSFETRLFFGTFNCGDEGWNCRRIVVESPTGESMDLEVIPGDGQEVGLIVGPESTHPWSPVPPRRVTMSSGEVWLYGDPGRVRVKAHRR
jgi:hypothetical protein